MAKKAAKEPEIYTGTIRFKESKYQGKEFVFEADNGYEMSMFVWGEFIKDKRAAEAGRDGTGQLSENIRTDVMRRIFKPLADKRVSIKGNMIVFPEFLGKKASLSIASAADIQKLPMPRKKAAPKGPEI
jgi:hypothetical protein